MSAFLEFVVNCLVSIPLMIAAGILMGPVVWLFRSSGADGG